MIRHGCSLSWSGPRRRSSSSSTPPVHATIPRSGGPRNDAACRRMAVRGAGRGHGRGCAADRSRCGAAASGHRIDPGHAGRDRLGPSGAPRARESDERRRRRGRAERDDRRPRRLHVQRPSRRRLHDRGVQARLPRQHLRTAPSRDGTAGHVDSAHRRPAPREAHVSDGARRRDHGHRRRRAG